MISAAITQLGRTATQSPTTGLRGGDGAKGGLDNDAMKRAADFIKTTNMASEMAKDTIRAVGNFVTVVTHQRPMPPSRPSNCVCGAEVKITQCVRQNSRVTVGSLLSVDHKSC